MKNMVLMYADPTATQAMTAAERAEVFRRHEALHQDVEGTGEMLNGAGLGYPWDTTTLRWHKTGSTATTRSAWAKPDRTGRHPPSRSAN